ncbi:MAG: CpXC domain-containing protein, partial [Anaerolineales bacterium]
MPKTQLNCPNCRQPIVAEVEQLFDVGEDPQAKQRLLSGMSNFVNCPHCGYEGSLATPIVYHDPNKELLLTFLPPELSMPREEQERIIGSMINRVMDRLPQEKRKAYLLSPQAALTLQGLIERILEADGITKEMIQAQEDRLNLLRRLMTASSEDARKT